VCARAYACAHDRITRVRANKQTNRGKKNKGGAECKPMHLAIMGHCVMGCTGWRRVIGCLKLQVTFRKRATNYRALLRKMTGRDKACYDSTPPCRHMHGFILVRFGCARVSVMCTISYEYLNVHV